MTQAIAKNAIEREVRIEASPEIVYSYFTDPEKVVRWMSREASVDARPGGEIRLDYNGFDRMRGEFLELVPHSRVVFTWGWETLGSGTPPGASRVEVTLTPDGEGTMLRLVHSGLSESEVAGHATGWDLFLPYLPEAVRTGAAAQPAAAPLTPAERAAATLNASLCDLRYLLEGMTAGDWNKACPGTGWTAGVTAQHAVSHLALAHVGAMMAAGNRPPVADFTLDILAERNAASASENAGVAREDVLAALLADGPKAVEAVKTITDEGLARAFEMAFARGQPVPAAAILEGPLNADIRGHIEDIRAALRG